MMFPEHQVYCIIDYETFSEAELKKTGAFEYSMHPSTDVVCVAWKLGTRKTLRKAPVKDWSPLLDDDSSAWQAFGELQSILADPSIVMVAHNAFFEQMITRNCLAWRYCEKKGIDQIPTKRWICTAALSAAMALPRKLEHVAKVLGSPIEKDMKGHRLMLKLSKPRKPTTTDPSVRHVKPEKVKRVVQYCRTDIGAEEHVFLTLPELTPTERKLWLLDQKLNLRGFAVDRSLIRKVRKMVKIESERLDQEVAELTEGALESTRSPAAVLKFIREDGEGAELPNLQKETVEVAIRSGLVEGRALRLLQIRQTSSLTSIAKYPVLTLRSGTDGRVRDNLIYHTASTGRWGGAGFQPQNLPRGTIKNTLEAVKDLATGDIDVVRMLHGDPMQVFSSCIRNMIIAPEDKEIDVADYSQIEVRVLFWVAGDERGLNIMRDPKRDIYREMAAQVFGKRAEDIDALERFLGKELELGCGYNMGPEKFQSQCEKKGQKLPDELCQKGVRVYRETHHKVVALWKLIERAAIGAVQNPGRVYSLNRTKWFMKDDYLWCELPSGRRLAYASPTIKAKKMKWGEMKPTLYHWGVDSKTRKWVNAGTYGGKLVENVIQAIARDLMATAMLRIERAGIWKLILTVHDELIAERKKGLFGPELYRVDNREKMLEHHPFIQNMIELPDWAEGCPIAAEGWSGTRYRK